MRASAGVLVLILVAALCGCRDGGKTGAKTAAGKTPTAKTTKTAGTKTGEKVPPEGKTPIDIEPKKTGETKPAPKQTDIPLKDPEGK